MFKLLFIGFEKKVCLAVASSTLKAPPPLLTVWRTLVQLKLGGAVSFRTVALQVSSSHVSLRNIKSRLFVVIKSLMITDKL